MFDAVNSKLTVTGTGNGTGYPIDASKGHEYHEPAYTLVQRYQPASVNLRNRLPPWRRTKTIDQFSKEGNSGKRSPSTSKRKKSTAKIKSRPASKVCTDSFQRVRLPSRLILLRRGSHHLGSAILFDRTGNSTKMQWSTPMLAGRTA